MMPDYKDMRGYGYHCVLRCVQSVVFDAGKVFGVMELKLGKVNAQNGVGGPWAVRVE